jgi:hypothetical protein
MVTIDSYDDSIPKDVMRPLAEALQRTVLGREINHHLLYQIDRVLYNEVVRIRQKGFKIPPLVAIVVQSKGWVEIVRADMEHAGIQRVIQNIIQRFPDISGFELAMSVRRAFPAYVPDDAQGEHKRVTDILANKRV